MATATLEATTTTRTRFAEGVRAWSWALARGLTIGAGVGIAYRLWMRLISTNPSFSWDGTIFIILLGVFAGVGASLARTARTRFRRRWARGVARTLGTIAVLALGLGQGMIALPVWLLGGLAWARSQWNRWVRVALLALAAGATWMMFHTIAPDLEGLHTVRRLLAVPTFFALAAAIAMLFTWPTRVAGVDPSATDPASAVRRWQVPDLR